jgi:hypothetical protein
MKNNSYRKTTTGKYAYLTKKVLSKKNRHINKTIAKEVF